MDFQQVLRLSGILNSVPHPYFWATFYTKNPTLSKIITLPIVITSYINDTSRIYVGFYRYEKNVKGTRLTTKVGPIHIIYKIKLLTTSIV
jgi:hypothetical protein